MFQSMRCFAYDGKSRVHRFGLKQDKLPKAEITSRVNEMLGLVRRSLQNVAASAFRRSAPARVIRRGTAKRLSCSCWMNRWARWIKNYATPDAAEVGGYP